MFESPARLPFEFGLLPRPTRAAANRWSVLRTRSACRPSSPERCCPPLVVMYLLGYNSRVIEVRQTAVYARWFDNLRDRRVRARIDARIRRLSLGNPGDVKPVGEGVSELRIDYGPGYRVYFVQRGQTLVILLAGGDKDTQDRDIRTAIELAREL